MTQTFGHISHFRAGNGPHFDHTFTVWEMKQGQNSESGRWCSCASGEPVPTLLRDFFKEADEWPVYLARDGFPTGVKLLRQENGDIIRV